MRQLPVNLNEILLAVSFALDFVEIDVLGATSNHSKRVAAIAMKLGRRFGFTDAELFDLCSFAVLHDNGIAEENLNCTFSLGPGEKGTIAGLEKYREHCEHGERNIDSFPFQTGQREIIRYHHEKYDGSGFYGLRGSEIPLMAQLIAIADTVDNLYHFEREETENRRAILRFVQDYRGRWFAPEVADALLSAAKHSSFWLDLHNQFIDHSVRSLVPRMTVESSWEELYEMTKVFSRIIDAKSKFTARHSTGLEEKVCALAGRFGYGEGDGYRLCIAAHLHDLGKLAVPNSILDKNGKLTAEELEPVYAHPYYTRKALERVSLFGEIVDWAANHHERLDGSGYPYGLRAEELPFLHRLFMALDMYQALTEERPYRSALDHREACSLLEREVTRGRLDARIVEEIHYYFQE